jgi:hypothetical protein
VRRVDGEAEEAWRIGRSSPVPVGERRDGFSFFLAGKREADPRVHAFALACSVLLVRLGAECGGCESARTSTESSRTNPLNVPPTLSRIRVGVLVRVASVIRSWRVRPFALCGLVLVFDSRSRAPSVARTAAGGAGRDRRGHHAVGTRKVHTVGYWITDYRAHPAGDASREPMTYRSYADGNWYGSRGRPWVCGCARDGAPVRFSPGAVSLHTHPSESSPL